ncbi:hypothetical protein F750_6619 [Streptomyces sp. PAMC 26508]|nr:hypothetical protein F750_6619 [Streptomyces sp. PAMC 26508]
MAAFARPAVSAAALPGAPGSHVDAAPRGEVASSSRSRSRHASEILPRR